MEALINILHICDTGTMQLGPGLRYCIWVQGCPFNCKGCITPEGIPIVPNHLIPLENIYHSILSNTKIKGITLTGGEPFLQASKLSILLQKVREARPELNVVAFSGFKKTQLDWPEARLLLTYIDVLIDGTYIEKYDDNLGLRGSSNQKVHYLTDRLLEERQYFEQRQRSLDVFVQNGKTIWVGIPNRELNQL